MSRSHLPSPEEVFTPASPPLGEHAVYVTRSEAVASLDRHVTRHQVPVVWGEYGVGKTTLVQRYFQETHEDGRLIYIASVAGLSMVDIFRTVLEHLNYRVEIERSVSDGGSGGLGFDLKVIKIDARIDGSESVKSQLLITSPTDTRLNQLMQEANITLVLDEMHRASPELRTALADWIKATRAQPEGLTLVLVGTSTDAGRLVALDTGIDRYVKEMSVGLLTEDEARFIIDEGFRRLELNIESDLRARMISAAAGAPTIIQTLCLDAALSAIAAGRSEVVEDDLQGAVDLYLQEHGGRLATYYWRAIETTGPRRYRKQVLMAVAMVPNDYATMEDIRTGVSKSLGEPVPGTSLSGPLRELKTAQYDNILKDVDRPVSGTRVHNLTAFTDPMMKSFVRFMNNLDQSGFTTPRA
jgi:type II secretory pathway predicted ATPase ExeA